MSRKHPRPFDPFRAKAIADRNQYRADHPKAAPKPAWKDQEPFSGTRRDGQPIGEAVQIPVIERTRRRRHLVSLIRVSEELGLYDQEAAA